VSRRESGESSIEAPLAIRMAGIVKSFGPVMANRDASLEVARGEIHALVGENGAGKSTLMRILAGMYPPDDGSVEVEGRDVTGWRTSDAIRAGVGMVHQHFMLVPTLSVAENVVLGQERTKGALLDTAGAEDAVRELGERTGLKIQPDRTVASLSVGEAQRVEILKTLYRGARILILDEPTAVLSPPEVRELWQVLRRLKMDGGTVVLITHKLDEVVEISDTITVMRSGSTVERIATATTSPQQIARAMVGRDVALPTRGSSGAIIGGETPSAPVLAVQNLVVPGERTARAVDGVSFELQAGEILGIAGVEGNGQTELVEAIAGLRAPSGGRVILGKQDVTAKGVRARADLGLAHVPEDRHHRGLVLDYSIADNLILGQQHHFASRWSLDRARIDEHAERRVREFDIRPPTQALPARSLSGGNQQKIVIAREMGGSDGNSRDFMVLLASQPTRGVDVGAIEFIHSRILAARDAGKGVLLVSADLNEILALSTRVAVMYRGRFVVVLPGESATADVLGSHMTGAA
jgi:general nucleoside transport system ATP-binding protein